MSGILRAPVSLSTRRICTVASRSAAAVPPANRTESSTCRVNCRRYPPYEPLQRGQMPVISRQRGSRLDDDGDLVISPLSAENVPAEAVALKAELTELPPFAPSCRS